MADLAKVKRNVSKMVSMNAPETDIDDYIMSEGTTIDEIRNFKQSQGLPFEQQPMTMGGFGKNIIPSAIKTGTGIVKGLPMVAGQAIKTAGDIGKGIFTGDISGVSQDIGDIQKQAVSGSQDIQNRYGSIPAIKQTAYTDPIGTALDVASILPMGKAAQLAGKAYKTQIPTRMAEKGAELSKEATGMFREILRPTQGEIKNIEIRGNRKIDDLYKLAAEEKLPIKQTADKKLDTTDAVVQVKEKMSTLNDSMNTIIQNNKATESLEKLRKRATAEMNSKYKNAAEREDAINDVNSYIDAEIRQYGDTVSIKDLNNIKQGMWSVGYNALKPTASKTARTIGHLAKEAIENAIPDKSVRALNEQIGKYATLNNLLENAQGRVVAGGRIGGYMARILGGIAGHSTGLPIVGTLAGEYLGGKAANAIYAPERASAIAGSKMSQAIKYNMGQIIDTSKGKVKVVGFDTDSHPLIEPFSGDWQ